MLQNTPNSKVHGANMGPSGGRQDPGGPHVGPMSFAIWDCLWYARTAIIITATQSYAGDSNLGLSVGYKAWPPIGWHHPVAID